MQERATAEAREVGRTAQDACATLVELGRALKGWLFYEDGHPDRRDLLDRAWRVVRSEIARGGPLALEVRRGAFWLAGTDVAVGVGRVDELARRFYERAVGRVAFDVELDADSLGGLLDVLATPPEDVAGAGGFELLFYTGSRRGVRINDSDWRALLERVPLLDATLETTLPEIAAPALSERDVVAGETSAQIDLLDELDLDPRPAQLEPEPPPELLAFDDTPVPREVAAPAPLLDEVGERLRDLAEREDDARYRDGVRQLVFDAQALAEQGRLDDVHRVLLALAAHAGDDAKRSFAQRESAREGLVALGRGAALGDLIRRACEADSDASLRAVGVLREIGAPAVPRLLHELESPGDPERRARLTGVMLALGEDAAPALGEALASGSPPRQRAALRLAGETQNPRFVPSLREGLLRGSDEIAREAAQALVRVGDVAAFEALFEALESARPAVVACAAQALGGTGRALALGPLAAALDRAIAAGQQNVVRDLARALGRLGRPESAGPLAEVLARGGFFQRAKLREAKLAAVTALTQVPGRAADEALARAAKGGDAQVRQLAELALRRRVREGRLDKARV
jgi:HEAT repeat protein